MIAAVPPRPVHPPTRERPRSITILGGTGSVGGSAARVLAEHPGLFVVEAVTGGSRVAELATLARQLRARQAVIADERGLGPLREALAGSGIEAAAGRGAVIEAAARPADLVLAGIVGAAGLEPSMVAVARGAILALANKESLVCAGDLLMAGAARAGAWIIPVDSEHSALFQALSGMAPPPPGDDAPTGPHRPVPLGEASAAIERLVLTASGGPFRELPMAAMATATPAMALAHPTWSMGAKISIDSATMMNKGLEIIEAHHLFAVPEAAIEVLVHPGSIVHSLVGFVDGGLLAQLGTPDMRVPIACALGWPARLRTSVPRLDLAALGRLDFRPADPVRFPALALARAALRAGGVAPTMLNAANEVCVDAFLAGRIGFLDIVRINERVMARSSGRVLADLGDVLACDREARAAAAEQIATARTLSGPPA